MTTSQPTPPTNPALVWFGRIVLLGVACNVALSVFAIAAPNTFFNLIGFPLATPWVWPRFAAFLMILMSGFYIPPALAPSDRQREAIWTVGCRAGGVVFFLITGGPYVLFAGIDFVFGVPQGILLWRGLTAAKARI